MIYYTGEKSAYGAEDVLKSNTQFGFPPIFNNTNIPYMKALEEGYKSINKYVIIIIETFSEYEISLLEQWKYETIRRTTYNIDPSSITLNKFITTFIWQVSLLPKNYHTFIYFY